MNVGEVHGVATGIRGGGDVGSQRKLLHPQFERHRRPAGALELAAIGVRQVGAVGAVHPNLVHSHCVLKSLDVQANGFVDFEYGLAWLLLHASTPLRPELCNELMRQLPLSVGESGADATHGSRHRVCPIAIVHRPDRQILEALDADAADIRANSSACTSESKTGWSGPSCPSIAEDAASTSKSKNPTHDISNPIAIDRRASTRRS